jgi:uncharacterized protein (DUF433 family)
MAGLEDQFEPLAPPLTPEQKAEHRRHGELWRARRAKLLSRITVDPKTMGGAAHIKGTRHTIAAIRAAWAERGVLSHHILNRFHGLTADDVEAALIHWSDPSAPLTEPEPRYVADWDGPPRRRVYLFRASNENEIPVLWQIVASEFDDDGEELPHSDTIDEGFENILRYTTRYAPRDIVWRDATSGEVVDIYSLKGA